MSYVAGIPNSKVKLIQIEIFVEIPFEIPGFGRFPSRRSRFEPLKIAEHSHTWTNQKETTRRQAGKPTNQMRLLCHHQIFKQQNLRLYFDK